jgi:GNAT superfamily N-acetyltransferase
MLTLKPVTKENIKDIPGYCKQCLYWQTVDADKKPPENQTEKIKQNWLLRVQKEEGISGYIAYVNSAPVGYVQLAWARHFPRLKKYTNAVPSKDAVFLACLYIPKRENQNKGYGTQMLRSLIAELRQRGFKAIETFARKSSSENPSGPLGFYLKNGFNVKRDDSDFPLARLNLA